MVVSALLISAAQANEPALTQITQPQRVGVMLVLLGLLALAIVLILLTWLGARVTRNYMSGYDRTQRRGFGVDHDDWTRTPLNQQADLPEVDESQEDS